MQEFFIESKFDDLDLSCLLMEAKGKPKGIVQIAHGMSEHKERYIPFMEFLVSKGYIGIINDHRGHGKSIKSPEDLGYFYDDKALEIVDDLYTVTKYIKEKYPEVPVCLFGHSMGSMVVRNYIAKYDDKVDKLIVCGSPSKTLGVNIGIELVNILSKIKGDHYRSKFIDNMLFGSYDEKFLKESEKNTWLSKNRENVKNYNDDELCGFVFTLNGFKNLFYLMKNTYKKSRYEVKNSSLPILFIAGSNDPVIEDIESWHLAQEFLKKVGYTNIKGIIYNDLRHEILNEEENAKVFSDILTFFDEE